MNNNYSIKGFEEGPTEDVLVVRLDCCGTGDLAYVNKMTKEGKDFSPGDI